MPPSDPHAVVAGGGIGGLAAAACLVAHGWRVTVLERSPDLGELGAGFGLTSNGLAALSALGLEGAARAASHPAHMAGTDDERGRPIIGIADRGPSTAMRGMHRQALHDLLRRAAGDARMLADANVLFVKAGDADGALARVHYRRGGRVESLDADLVIGADGIRSPVRSAVAPAAVVRYSGMSSWRGIVDDEREVPESFTIVWGPAAEFGALRVDERRVYWYGYVRLPERTHYEDERAEALARFASWSDPVCPLIARTPAERLLRHDVYSLRPGPRRYTRGRVALVGDAAHAMLPTMGQGVNLALEDAVTIGTLAHDGTRELGAALARYDELRVPRTRSIARRSAAIGAIGSGLAARPLIAFRNTALRLAAADRMADAGSVIFDWLPPETIDRPDC
jgi:2-polyprenyl-6-methoxyphenol hydroxylase-like FAD-dependent oxidoreductase